MTGMQPWAAPGLAAGYHLADANDFSGNSKTLTNNGSVAFGLGKFGNCAQFGSSNTSKYLSRSDGLGVDLRGAFGVSAWVYLQANPASGKESRVITWLPTTGAGRQFILAYRNTSGTYGILVHVCGTDIVCTYTMSLEKWYKIDVSVESGGSCYIYINGVLIGSGSRGTAEVGINATFIGCETNQTAGYFWSGNIDEVLFFNVHRTSQDIRRAYAFQRGMLI